MNANKCELSLTTPAHRIGRATLKYFFHWWRGMDSNHRTLSGQIYSLVDLTTLPPLHGFGGDERVEAWRREAGNALGRIARRKNGVYSRR